MELLWKNCRRVLQSMMCNIIQNKYKGMRLYLLSDENLAFFDYNQFIETFIFYGASSGDESKTKNM